MTSNLGAKHLLSGLKGSCSMQVARGQVMEEVGKHFKPELLNRLDEIVVFDPLSREQLRKVAGLQMKDVASRLAEQGIALAFTGAVLNSVLAHGVTIRLAFSMCVWFSTNFAGLSRIISRALQAYGARPSRRWLEKKVVTELSEVMVMDEMDEDWTVHVNAGPNKQDLVYRVEKNGSNEGDELEIEDEALKYAHRSKT